MLGDLISLWEIGIEVVLTGEIVGSLDFAATGQPHADREFHRPAVGPGQGAGITQGDGAYMRIGLAAKAGGIATEKLRPGKQLGMDLEPYDYFVCIIAPHPANL